MRYGAFNLQIDISLLKQNLLMHWTVWYKFLFDYCFVQVQLVVLDVESIRTKMERLWSNSGRCFNLLDVKQIIYSFQCSKEYVSDLRVCGCNLDSIIAIWCNMWRPCITRVILLSYPRFIRFFGCELFSFEGYHVRRAMMIIIRFFLNFLCLTYAISAGFMHQKRFLSSSHSYLERLQYG